MQEGMPPGQGAAAFNPMFDDSQFTRNARKQPHSLGNAEKNRANLAELGEKGSSPGGAGRHHKVGHSSYKMHQHTATAPLGAYGNAHASSSVSASSTSTAFSPYGGAHAGASAAAPAGSAAVGGVHHGPRMITENSAEVDRRMLADLHRQQEAAKNAPHDVFEDEYAQAAVPGGTGGGYFGSAGSLRGQHCGNPAASGGPNAIQEEDFDF